MGSGKGEIADADDVNQVLEAGGSKLVLAVQFRRACAVSFLSAAKRISEIQSMQNDLKGGGEGPDPRNNPL